MCDEELLNRFISCNIKRSDISLIAAVIAKLEDARVLCSAFDGIDGLLRNRTTAYQYEREWATALGRLLESPMVEKERKKSYADKYGAIRERFLRPNRTG
jgi:hypothetical protein